jgi:uncharacterized protein
VDPTDAAGDRPVFVDTNVFLRFFTNDVPEQAAAAEALFRRAEAGEVRLVTNAMVIAEIVRVLGSYYRLTRAQVQEHVLAVILMEGLDLPEIDLVSHALSSYGKSSAGFIDAYNAAWMTQRRIGRVATFDATHFAGAEGLEICLGAT